MSNLHHKKQKAKKHKSIALIVFSINLCFAVMWGPLFITLTLLGPLKHLSSTVVWVAIISYYANMMGNLATAAGLYSSMVAHDAHDTAIDTAADLAEHEQLQRSTKA